MTLRITGMASGLDTDSIIASLIEARQVPITTLETEISEAEDEYDTWDDLNEELQDFQDKASSLMDYTVWQQKAASSTDEDVVTATVDEDAASTVTGTYKIVVSQLAQAHRVGSSSLSDLSTAGTTTATSTSEALGISGTFSVNGVDVTVDSDDSMEDIVSTINSAFSSTSTNAAKASIIGSTLLIEQANTGSTKLALSESGSSNSVLRSLGILSGTSGESGDYSTIADDHVVQAAQDLKATVNGVAITSSSNTKVTSAVSGLSLSFTEEGSATLTVANDTETIKSLIEDFVDSYNDIWEQVTELGAATMDDTSGSLSSVGALQGDSTIAGIKNRLRSIVGSVISDPTVADESMNSLYKLGIWFNKDDDEDDEGYLSIYDEDKLDAALEDNYDEVKDFFRAYGTNNSGGGIMRQLDTYLEGLTSYGDGVISFRMSTLSDEIDEKEDKIDYLEADLEKYQEELYEHYAHMETTVSSLNQQLSYITSLISG